MAYAMPVVTKEESVWVLRLRQSNGKTQEYRCSTESQARQLALVLSRPEQDAQAHAQPA
jgi:hypothetical protein